MAQPNFLPSLEITPLLQSDAFSELYFLSYANGLLTVSEKRRQQLIFDQNLSDTSALSPPIDLLGYSVEPALSGAISFTVSGGQSTSPFYLFTDSEGQTPDFSSPLVRGQTYHFIADGISTDHPFMIGELMVTSIHPMSREDHLLVQMDKSPLPYPATTKATYSTFAPIIPV